MWGLYAVEEIFTKGSETSSGPRLEFAGQKSKKFLSTIQNSQATI